MQKKLTLTGNIKVLIKANICKVYSHIILSWKHKYKQTFAITYSFMANKLCATDLSISPNE